jgi:hypothetical protein
MISSSSKKQKLLAHNDIPIHGLAFDSHSIRHVLTALHPLAASITIWMNMDSDRCVRGSTHSITTIFLLCESRTWPYCLQINEDFTSTLFCRPVCAAHESSVHAFVRVVIPGARAPEAHGRLSGISERADPYAQQLHQGASQVT